MNLVRSLHRHSLNPGARTADSPVSGDDLSSIEFYCKNVLHGFMNIFLLNFLDHFYQILGRQQTISRN